MLSALAMKRYQYRLNNSNVPQQYRKHLKPVIDGKGCFALVTKPITVYKKAHQKYHKDSMYYTKAIVLKLTLPVGTFIRLSDYSAKCRATMAYVEHYVGNEAVSGHDSSFKYPKETLLFPKQRFARRDYECASGIHFFFTRQRAASY